MGINDERDIEANLQIGPTTDGMVRLFVEGGGIEIPMDFDPEEAEEIAEELQAAAAQARAILQSAADKSDKGGKKKR
ncbi:DUF6324 family protein [Aliiroseovarius crassostreae]|uniref:DUF6324 family protein n=1 Tax=Aliiroseovarius crassostreae TaxID=154981 RepID=UPI002202F736|nr:DUF6324 family protein [Aliiroseovarius crassostreae]UWP87898.1 hypothetical protein K3J57_08060 [Aliiroseovarius crassostreae]